MRWVDEAVEQLRKALWALPVIAGLLVAALISGLVWGVEQTAREQRQQEADSLLLEQLATLRAQLESELNTTIFLTYGLSAYVAANPSFSTDEVNRLVDDLLRRSRHVSHVAFAPGNVISHVHPMAGNEAAIGLDFMRVPQQRTAVELAMGSHQLVVTGPVDLVQGGRALATRDPVYSRDGEQPVYWGLVTTIIRLESLAEAAGLGQDNRILDVAVRDETTGQIILGESSLFNSDTQRLTIRLPGAAWEMAGTPVGGATAMENSPWAVLGYAFALVAGGMSWRLLGQGLALRVSEQRYRSFIQSLPDGVCITQAGQFRYINPRLAELTGHAPEELEGHAIVEVVHPDDRPMLLEARRQRMSGEAQFTENDVRVRRADGSLFTARLNTSLIEWAGQPAALTTVTDITERQELQRALTESRDRLAALMQALPDVAFVLDRQGQCLDAFGGTQSQLFSDAQGMIGRNLLATMRAELADRCLAIIEQALGRGCMQTLVYSVDGPDHTQQWVEARVVPLGHDAAERVTVLWLAFDITSHKRTELSLRQREAAFQALVENSPDVISRMDRQLRFVYISPAVESYSGITPEEHLGKTALEVGVPADLAEIWEEQFARVFAGEGIQSTEFRFASPDGQILYFESRAIPEYSADGQVQTVLVIDREITDRKRNENQLRLAASVFHNTSEAMLVADADRQVVRCNPSFTRLTGYRLGDIVGRPTAYLRTQSAEGMLGDDCWELVHSRGHWEGEVTAHRQDGDEFAAWLTVNAIRDQDNRISHYLLVLEDISHRKRWEEQLRHEATHDALTGLPNRTLLTDRLTVALAQAKRANQTLALLFLDLDNFKPINDALGHRAGDRVLRIVGERMRQCVRETDTVARLGGDEFVVVLMPPTDDAAVENIARMLLSKLPEPIVMQDQRFEVSASIGIARYPRDGASADVLLNAADAAMYDAKSQGRARYQFYAPLPDTNVGELAGESRIQRTDGPNS
ncbi:diguanylate cyclase (GGDEF)-like protein/PAS domain S-box-containing protein [Natronocella acetinitrilica]|uniref:Diguanylate cyclase (GGDEF)-like protein/PAS domain S-box-containing protein n=1 Tax=Natronocella acetinitrilica TaxID=414046 RepID=A0AAE3G5P0_9GAMM|nr:PAS domain S-box protein [Natronocella acetinitrilica]MCP1675191.1 diguanylate cyclase (GGDEF)-like protein/PAS domain S-box-containing protein [Natronocella acetinitrilica]